VTKRITLLLFILPLILLAACGPAQAPADGAAGAPETPVAAAAEDEGAAQTAVSAPATDPATDSAPAGPTAIPSGFTPEGRPYRGDLNAPVILEEFSDYQCPFCARFTEQTLPGLLEAQIATGEVLLVYHDFPLESIHGQALAASNAARCAGDQSIDSYWAMHDMLYERMQEWGVANPDPVFAGMAAEIGLDQAAFDACVAALTHEEAIRADIEYALSQGVRSTPSFLVNGQALVGAQPLAAFNQAIAMVQDGQELAAEAPAPPQDTAVLPPPRVAPQPVTISGENAAATLGDPDAPVTIVEFSDYQCPFCRRHALETLPALRASQIDTGQVYYIFKDLPLESIHPTARAAAKAARCGGEQDAYWAMHEALFEAQEDWGSGDLPATAVFSDLAAGLELDRAAFDACMEDGRFDQAIQANIEEAQALGANSTPTFFIDGYPVAGAQPPELFDYAVGLAALGQLADAYVPPAPALDDAFAIGDPDAPVTIVEYTDFQCPFCSRYHEQSFDQIVANFVDTGQVRYVFKDFPLTNIHPQAVAAAEAARCAGEQEARLPMYTQLFAAQGEWSGQADAADLFKQYAQELGLDTAVFAECLDSGRMQAAIRADMEEAQQQGVTGTPAFLMNGRLMSGAQPYEIFERAINQLLAEAGG
jgi:protein-disulfide isomerase